MFIFATVYSFFIFVFMICVILITQIMKTPKVIMIRDPPCCLIAKKDTFYFKFNVSDFQVTDQIFFNKQI